jgi:HSP20 family protein
MSNSSRWGRPSIFNLRRDIDDTLDEFMPPRALRREIDRLFGEDLSPRTLWNEMDRMFDEFVAPTTLRRRIESLFEPYQMGTGSMAMRSRGDMFVPELELVERDNEYSLHVDLPGVRQQDVQISVDDNHVLTVRGERREEQNKQSRGYEYTERSYGSFMRSIELPRNIDESKIDADYRDGVLMLHIPKTEQQSVARKIQVRGQQALPQGQQQQGQQHRDQPRVMSPGAANGNERRETRNQANAR